jgi:hypothetical protein
MLQRVISGGQTGVDQAALRAAKSQGIPTGGFAPKGWQTEEGPAPWLAEYGLVECGQPGYPARTEANVESADATVIILAGASDQGTELTRTLCSTHEKTSMEAGIGETSPGAVASWIRDRGIRVLNIAGPREGSSPGIAAAAEAFLTKIFAILRRDPV